MILSDSTMKEANVQLQGIILGNTQFKFRTIKCEVSSLVGNPIIFIYSTLDPTIRGDI